jgi:[protein-PII] uridylyltransferase
MPEPTAPPADVPAPVARLLDELSALDRAYSLGHHGRWSAARRAELVDTCLRALFVEAQPRGVDLVALGGYGRGLLAPGSDVDLLIVHDPGPPDDVAELAERLLYPLWDAGLGVGHAVRTQAECGEVATSRLDAATSMLDGRLLAGDGRLWAGASDLVRAGVRRDPSAFAARLREDARARAERYGAVSALLEPDLKEGTGGLRDVQTLGWLQTAIEAPLEDAGLLRASERAALEEADEFLFRARSAIHLETRRSTDRLLLELQPAIAGAMGFLDEPELLAVDALMRAVFDHARHVQHVVGSVFDRFDHGTGQGAAIEPTPAGILEALTASARAGGAIPVSVLDAIEAGAVVEDVEWSERVREAFLELLRTGSGAAVALESLDRTGLLVRYLPAWAAVRCRPQRDPYHRYSVDVHLLHALAAAGDLLGDAADDPLAAQAARAVGERDGLLLGALLHDIGKNGRGNHVAEGVRIADETLDHIGLTGPSAELARFLVAEHLLLSDTATRRDLEDDDLVLDVAATVGTPERLAALYLLTIADASATGPLAWTPWRATLVRELVAKVQRVLERGQAGVETAERLSERRAAVRDALAKEDPDEVEEFVERMPPSVVLGVAPERVARHFALLSTPIGAVEVRTLAGEGSRPSTYDLTVVAADRPGLLSMIAGALSLSGLSILTAQVFTTDRGEALDLFEVEGAFDPVVGEDRWREFRGTLRRAIEGRISLDHRVREKREHYPVTRHDIPLRVSVDNDTSDFFTVIEVSAPDRIGLLFDITRSLAELGLDVHLAKVATYGERVVDVFYVRDELGRQVDDPDRLSELERSVRTRLAE